MKIDIGNGNLRGDNITTNESKIINKLYGQQALINIASQEYLLTIQNSIANPADLMDCSHNAEYTYMARETENIMDYSQLNAIRTSETMGNKYALFYWQ